MLWFRLHETNTLLCCFIETIPVNDFSKRLPFTVFFSVLYFRRFYVRFYTTLKNFLCHHGFVFAKNTTRAPPKSFRPLVLLCFINDPFLSIPPSISNGFRPIHPTYPLNHPFLETICDNNNAKRIDNETKSKM